jgi:transposase
MSLPGIRPGPHKRLCGTGKIAENRPQIREAVAATADLRICRDFFSSLLRSTASPCPIGSKQGGAHRTLTSQVAPLLDQIDDPIGQVTADGAYDGAPTYQTIAQHGDGIEVVIPPRSTTIPSGEPGPPTRRDRHLAMIAEQGRLAWQIATDYGQRSLVETTMGRYKSLIGPRLRARGFAGQQTEAAIGVAVLNRMLAAGRPASVRRQAVIA